MVDNKDFHQLIKLVKQQQAVISQQQAALVTLIMFLEKDKTMDRDEFDEWIVKLRNQWPDKHKIDDQDDQFGWLLNRPAAPNGDDPEPGTPGWVPQVIPGGRSDDTDDQ